MDTPPPYPQEGNHCNSLSQGGTAGSYHASHGVNYHSVDGLGEGGGLYIHTAATPYLDAFTVANVSKNTASSSDPNIHGSHTATP